jgi:hypothetical protein
MEGHEAHEEDKCPNACIYLFFLLFLELHLDGRTCGRDILFIVEVIAWSKP